MSSAVLICTHGRPNKQYTYNAIREAGYTGLVYLIVDDEDPSIDKLNSSLGYNIVQFCKQEYINTIDIGYSSSSAKRSAILYAKCACEDFAEKMRFDNFIIADDDITGFRYRYEKDGHLLSVPVTKNMDKIITEYYNVMNRADIIATSFGDVRAYIGGQVKESRLPYNFVFRNGYYRFDWKAEMYEDTVSPIFNNIRGKYTVQFPQVQYMMKEVDAKEDGGMREIYDTLSIFKRAFVAKIFSPTCIKLANNKVGFELQQDKAFPKLISSTFKK